MGKRGYHKAIKGILKHCPQEFDIDDYSLSELFCLAAVEIDNYIIGRDNLDFRPVARTGKVLYTILEHGVDPFEYNPTTVVFLHEILEEQTGKRYERAEEMIDPLKSIALDFLKMKELPRQRKEELRSFALELSKKAEDYWQRAHPHGFKEYAA